MGGGGKCIIIVSSSSSIKNVEGALNDLDLLKVIMRVSHIITVFMWSAMVLTIGYYTVQLHINQSASLCCFFSLVNLQCSNNSKCWCLQDLWSQVADNCVTGKEGKKYWHTQNSTRKFTQIHAKPTQLHKNKPAWNWGEGRFESPLMTLITVSSKLPDFFQNHSEVLCQTTR